MQHFTSRIPPFKSMCHRLTNWDQPEPVAELPQWILSASLEETLRIWAHQTYPTPIMSPDIGTHAAHSLIQVYVFDGADETISHEYAEAAPFPGLGGPVS